MKKLLLLLASIFSMQAMEDPKDCLSKMYDVINSADVSDDAQHKQIAELNRLLSLGLDINASYPLSCGFTALHYAVSNGRFELVKWLVDKGANPHIENCDNQTALDIAVRFGGSWVDVPRPLEMAALLKKSKCNMFIPRRRKGKDYRKALSTYNSMYGLDVNLVDKEELRKAIKDNNITRVKQLFDQYRFDGNEPFENGYRPLGEAIFAGSEEVFRFLAEKRANIRLSVSTLTKGFYPIIAAAIYGQLSILKYLIEERKIKEADGLSLVCRAAFHGEEEVVRYLLKRPKCNFLIDGPIALLAAQQNNQHHIVELLRELDVPYFPAGKAPSFFYNKDANSLFDVKSLPIVADTQLPISKDQYANIYQIRVASQNGINEDCIQAQLKEAALKLGGKPKDHAKTNPIYGGACSYHAIKNALLGILILAEYDQLALQIGTEEGQEFSGARLQADIHNLVHFEATDDFDSKTFMEKIHAKCFRIHNGGGLKQGFNELCELFIYNKADHKLFKLLKKRYESDRAHSQEYISRVNIPDLMIIRDCDRYWILRSEIGYKKFAEDLIKQRELFHENSHHRHAFIVGYGSDSIDGYGIEDHDMALIIDKRESNINVLLLESNNLPEYAMKKIIFDLVETLVGSTSYRYAPRSIEATTYFEQLVEHYLTLKRSLDSAMKRDVINKALCYLNMIKYIIKRNLLTQDSEEPELKSKMISILENKKLLKKGEGSYKKIKKMFRTEEIALHQKFAQLELNERMIDSIMLNNFEGVRKAIAAGADPHYIVNENYHLMSFEMIKYLLENTDIDCNDTDSEGQTLLTSALWANEDQETIELLLNNYGDINAPDSRGCSPLMFVPGMSFSESDKLDMLKFLLNNGADPKEVNDAGFCVASIYFRSGHLELFEYIKKEYDIEVPLDELVSPRKTGIFGYADLTLSSKSLTILIDEYGLSAASHPELSKNVLFAIIKMDEPELFDRLFEEDFGLSPHVQDEYGWTLLMHAAQSRSMKIFNHLIEKQISRLNKLCCLPEGEFTTSS